MMFVFRRKYNRAIAQRDEARKFAEELRAYKDELQAGIVTVLRENAELRLRADFNLAEVKRFFVENYELRQVLAKTSVRGPNGRFMSRRAAEVARG